MSSDPAHQPYPTALVVVPAKRWPLLLALCCGLALGSSLLWYGVFPPGQRVQLTFRAAHGLQPRDPVRYLGVDIGVVERVQLGNSGDRVLVEIRLYAENAHFANNDSTCWISHPRLDWSGITGLDTIIGTRYVAFEPGRGDPTTSLVGLEEEPIRAPPGALPLTILAPERRGLERGGPLLYRGFCIGSISTVQLSADANTIVAQAFVLADYQHLVNTTSRFCLAPALGVQADITGIKVHLPPLAEVTLGGVVIVNSAEMGEPINPGHAFTLSSQDILEEQHPLAALPGIPESRLPRMRLVELHWRLPRSWWWDGKGSYSGQALPLAGGAWIPSQLLHAPAGAEGQELLLDGQPVPTPLASEADLTWWPAAGLTPISPPLRAARGPEAIVIGIGGQRALPVSQERLLLAKGSWYLPQDIPEALLKRGAPVLAAHDGAVVGLLAADPWRVLPIPASHP